MLVDGDKQHADELIRYTIENGYDVNRYRIAILIEIRGRKLSFSSFADMLCASELLNHQDILLYAEGKGYIIFRDIPGRPENLFRDYRNIIRVFLVTLSVYFRRLGISFDAYIGSIQNQMENYFYSYQHSHWMQKKGLHEQYFYDYLQDYIFETMPQTIIDGIFNVTKPLVDQATKENYLSMIRALMNQNYNINDASAALFIHKNTFNFRFNKIKEHFGIQPMQNDKDRKFAEALYYYLERD